MAYEMFQTGVSGGVNKDLAPQDLDLETYSTVHNLHLTRNRLRPVKGYEELYAPLPVAAPEYAFGVIRNSSPAIYMAGGGEINSYSGSVWNDVSRSVGGAYTLNVPWQHTILNGCVFLNNGSDRLQVLEKGDTLFKDSVTLPASFTARVFRGFKEYLFAINIIDKPQSLRWSDPALSGTEPPSWDITDPTTQAGEIVLADTDGELVDARQLADNLIIYKTDSVYSCRFVGGIYIFSFQKIFADRGALSANCVTTFEDKHFVVGFNDIYIHDGLKATSISENRVREFFYNDLDQNFLESVFVATVPEDKEVWVCYPDDNATNGAPNKALVWNWNVNSWSTRDIPNTSIISNAIIDPDVSDQWDLGLDDTWDLGGKNWDTGNFSPAAIGVLLTSKENGKIYQLSEAATFDEVAFDYVLEKLSSHYGVPEVIKQLAFLTPDIEGTGTITIRQGGQNSLGESIAWKPESTFPVGTYRVYGRGGARYFSVRFSGNTATCTPEIRGAGVHVSFEGEK